MFAKNIGPIDRAARIIVGIALLVGFFLNRDAAYSWLYLIGIVPLLTGLLGRCGLYSVFGISTCKLER